MMHLPATRTIRASAAGAAAAVMLLGVSACGDSTSGAELGTTVQEVQHEDADAAYDGDYDAAFYREMGSYAGQEVTLSADVNRIVSDHAFTLAGGDVEELLVVSADRTAQLQPDSPVKVTGTVHTAFDLPAVEDQVGADLDDQSFDEWGQEPYVEATDIDSSTDTEKP
ncbi:MAG TPA: hypothetical protein VFJ12_04800 [Segeticoccus sp.]|jgi:hypothetical protein|nr:hypothetical protein [Segeticoccus sp.]